MNDNEFLKIIENTIDNTQVESPCYNCYETYCYKNCDKYTDWENKAELIMKVCAAGGFDKFLIAKEVIEDGSGYGKTCDKKQYICPTCRKVISRPLCIRAHKPKHCHECGQLLMFKGD